MGRAGSVVTRSGRELPCDFVCVGVGIVPNAELAQHAGLGVDNGVVVNEFLEASHPGLYAAGEVASYLDPVLGKRRRVKGGALRAYFALGRDSELPALQQLIRGRASLAGREAQLRDPGFALEALG